MAGKIMNKLEAIKWAGTFFIILSPILGYFHYNPEFFLSIAIGTALWFIVGLMTKDKPMIFLNAVSTVLNLLAFFNN